MSDILTFIGGGVVGAAITFIGNWLMNKREELLEMLKIISRAAPYYNQLAMNAWNFSWGLTHNESDDGLLMYYMCNILQIRRQIVLTFGDLQFDNLVAERIIGDFGRDIFSLIKKKFNPVELSELTFLSENSKPYHEFHEIIKNNDLDNKFRKWIREEISDNDKAELEKKCAWYSQLIMLELNHLYRLWYREEPPLSLRADLRVYLQAHERTYLGRINAFETKTKLKKS